MRCRSLPGGKLGPGVRARSERRRDVKTLRKMLIVLVLTATFLPGQDVPAVAASPAGSRVIARNTGPAPRLPDGKPDFSGIWEGGGPIDDLAVGLANGEKIPLLPSAEKIMQARQSKDDPEAN